MEVSRGFAEDAMGRHIRTVTCHWQGIVVGTSLQEVNLHLCKPKDYLPNSS